MATGEPMSESNGPLRCPECNGGPIVVRLRVDTEVPALGFLHGSVLIDRSIFDDDVWEVDEVTCDECAHRFDVHDYEVA